MRFSRVKFLVFTTLFLIIVMFLFATRVPVIQTSEVKSNSQGKAITGIGCVEEGVEGGCLIVRDSKSKKVYNVFFETGKKPALNTAISFEGVAQEGPTTCMQGQPVQVKKWTALRLRCPIASEKEQKKKGEKGQMSEKNEAKCTEWKSWHDRESGHPATLHVTGQCTFPTSGFSAELRPHVPQGINPTIYILDRIVHSPADPVTNPRITTVPVHYIEETEKKYKSIEILPDQVEVPVKEVS